MIHKTDLMFIKSNKSFCSNTLNKDGSSLASIQRDKYKISVFN